VAAVEAKFQFVISTTGVIERSSDGDEEVVATRNRLPGRPSHW